MEIDDLFKQLGGYGLIIKMTTDMILGFWHPKQVWKIKALVVVLSVLAVYVFRVVDPVGLLGIKLAGLHEIVPYARKTLGVMILSGTTMGVHDAMEFIRHGGGSERDETV